MNRPFEPLGINTKDWMKIEPEQVEIALLIPTQTAIYEKLPKGHSYCGDPIIHVVIYEGKHYISDGHNRVWEAIQRGEKFIEARVLRKSFNPSNVLQYAFEIKKIA